MPEKYVIETDGKGSSGVMKGIVRLRVSLGMGEWEELRQHILDLLGNEYLEWEFDVTELNHCLSIDLGMWITMNATIGNHQGRLKFIANADSSISRIVAITNLDKVLEFEFV